MTQAAHRPLLSIAIPLYNKAGAIEETVKSCISVCDASDVDFEIVITNNCSTDLTAAHVDTLLGMHSSVRVINLEATISAPENWTYALNCCAGSLLTLQLADDLMPDVDLGHVIQAFSDPACDYVVGRTKPVFVEDCFSTNYFDLVNDFRARIDPSLALHEKINNLMDAGLIDQAHNPFGDINALYFRRDCLAILNRAIRVGLPSLGTYPDLDLYLQLFLHCNGCFLDQILSQFYYYPNSAPVECTKSGSRPVLYQYYDATLPLYILSHPAFDSLRPLLSMAQKQAFLQRIVINTRQLLGDTIFSDELSFSPQAESSAQLRPPLLSRIMRRLRSAWSDR